MTLSLFYKFRVVVERLEWSFLSLFSHKYPPDLDYCMLNVEADTKLIPKEKFSLRDLIGDGFLWAVPRTRRTIEKRWCRKVGDPKYFYKMMRPKPNLQICNVCGHDHEIGVLCPHCYKRIQDETKLMQDSIQNELGLRPVEKEVIVLYDGEKQQQQDEFWEGKRIVEMKKPRPQWFSRNLLQQTTQGPATTKDVKPSDLG